MKTFVTVTLALLLLSFTVFSQTPASALWQVNSFDLAVNVQQAERALNVTATIAATNIGGPGRTFTVRLIKKLK